LVQAEWMNHWKALRYQRVHACHPH
jgi:hypothetical protein